MAKINKRYYTESVSPLEYALNGLRGKMRSVNWNVINDEKDLEV